MLPERPSGCHAFSLFFRNAAPNCAKDALLARPAFRRATLSEFWSRKSGCVFRAEVRSYSDRNRVQQLDTPTASTRRPAFALLRRGGPAFAPRGDVRSGGRSSN